MGKGQLFHPRRGYETKRIAMGAKDLGPTPASGSERPGILLGTEIQNRNSQSFKRTETSIDQVGLR